MRTRLYATHTINRAVTANRFWPSAAHQTTIGGFRNFANKVRTRTIAGPNTTSNICIHGGYISFDAPPRAASISVPRHKGRHRHHFRGMHANIHRRQKLAVIMSPVLPESHTVFLGPDCKDIREYFNHISSVAAPSPSTGAGQTNSSVHTRLSNRHGCALL